VRPRHQAWFPNAASSLLAAFLLAACGEDAAAPQARVDPASLCVDSGCGEKTVLLSIPDAENLLFTPQGRLFVSGGLNVYEISRDASGYQARPLLDGSDNFTGLALRGDVLYANAFSGKLYAASLNAQPSLRVIHDLGLSSANGLAAGPDGELYVVNGPAALAPKIVRLRLNPADPFQVLEQSDWLSFALGTSFPNGLQVRGRRLYFSESTATALGRIRKLVIADDGQPGAPETLASLGASLPDDFSLAGEAVLAAYFSDGRIGLFAPDGQLLAQTDFGSFQSPSQVRLGQPPLFAETDLLVTEKGLLGENSSGVGNVLSIFRRKAATSP
jgi:hypothetical protein